MFLLGVVRSDWDYKGSSNNMAFSGAELRDVNLGMALITPLDELLKLITPEDQVKEGKKQAKAAATRTAPSEARSEGVADLRPPR